MYFKVDKGVTLMGLTITIIVMLIITGTIIYNTNNHLRIEKLNKLYNDIENLNKEIDEYYLKYGDIPTIGSEYCNKAELNTLLENNSNGYTLMKSDGKTINPNDSDEYYIIDVEKLEGLTLNYGYGADYNNAKNTPPDSITTDIDDIYIINKATHEIYYPSGVIVNDYMYYCYELNNHGLLNEKNITSDTGELNFNKDLELVLNSFKIYGRSIQNENPTSGNLVEIQNVGNKTNNLIDINDVFTNYNDISDSRDIIYKYIKLEPSTDYIMSTNAEITTNTERS